MATVYIAIDTSNPEDLKKLTIGTKGVVSSGSVFEVLSQVHHASGSSAFAPDNDMPSALSLCPFKIMDRKSPEYTNLIADSIAILLKG